MSRISVIIPNYNRAKLIGATIDNMLNQTLPPDEVIVVDDGSTDNSVEVIRSFGDRVHLIEQANQGPGAARNRGLEAASGEFIQFMDSDDLASLNKLEVQLAALKQTGADFGYAPWIRSSIQGKQIRFLGPVLQGRSLPAWKPMLEWQLGNWCTIFQSCLFRRKALDKAGWYCTDMLVAEDGEYLIRILLSGAQPVFTGDCLTFYRSNGSDQITSNASSQKRQAEDLTKYFERIGVSLADKLLDFHPSTRREAALKLYRHNLYCRRHGWAVVLDTNPISCLIDSYPEILLRFFDVQDRLRRKLSNTSASIPMCEGLMFLFPSSQTYSLAQQIGLLTSSD